MYTCTCIHVCANGKIPPALGRGLPPLAGGADAGGGWVVRVVLPAMQCENTISMSIYL